MKHYLMLFITLSALAETPTDDWAISVQRHHATAPRPGSGQVYDVCPTCQYQSPCDVPTQNLAPGDLVQIHYDPSPYRCKFILNNSGSEVDPIVVSGIPGPNGELPALDGDGAVESQYGVYPSSDLSQYGGILVADPDSYNGFIHDVIIQNLEFRNFGEPYGYTDKTGTGSAWPWYGAALYLYHPHHITISSVLIHDNQAQGLFWKSYGYSNGDAIGNVISNSVFFNNGVVVNPDHDGTHQHNVYVEGTGTLFHANYFGSTIAGSLGFPLKSRGGPSQIFNNVFRSSWTEDANLQDAQDGCASLGQLPDYGSVYFAGNVVYADTGLARLIDFGGEDGYTCAMTAFWAWHNTFVLQGDRNQRYGVDVIKNDYDIGQIHLYNNVFANVPQDSGAPTPFLYGVLAAAGTGGVLDLGNNVTSGLVALPDGQMQMQGVGQTFATTDNLFVGPSQSNLNFTPLQGSLIIGSGGALLSNMLGLTHWWSYRSRGLEPGPIANVVGAVAPGP